MDWNKEGIIMLKFEKDQLKRNKKLTQERKKAYSRNKKKIDDLYSRACNQHEGNLYLWLMFDRRKSKLEELEKYINQCGACALVE